MNDQTEISILCENVKRLRKRENLSKKEMARLMGIGVRSITMLENGVLPIRMKANALWYLKWRFGITIEELLSKIIEIE